MTTGWARWKTMTSPATPWAGVSIKTGGDPTLRRNQIHDNKGGGVHVHDNGLGTLEDNDITGNERGAWDIAEDCKANVTRARNKG